MRAQRFEGFVQVLILILVASMAGAASFTHVHDWTMRNVPAGTGSWLGWANAVITELVPAAAGIEIRRRKRQNPQRPVVYPMAILVIDAGVSVAVQLSDAIHTLAGGVAFALPALAFLALTKLVLSRSRTVIEKGDPECAQLASASDAPNQAQPSTLTTGAPATATGTTSPITPPPDNASSSPAALALTAFPFSGSLQPVPSAQLLASARMTAFAHRQATGNPITASEISSKLGVPPALAESLLDHIDGTPPPVTTPSGTVMNGSRP
jgi:hypothetical protein